MSRFIKDNLFLIYKFVFLMLGKILPKRKELIMFESFLGKQFSDNPRAIYEFLEKSPMEYDMYWSVERNSISKFENTNVQYVKRFSLKWMILMNSAKYWISNSRLPLWIPKPRNTIYLQTWHGTPLKKLATDMNEVHMPGINTEQYKRDFISETKKWDYLISPNSYSTDIFKHAFQYEKDIIESGYPRNDYLINCNNENEMKKIKEKINLPVDKKIILYAPTWRDNQYYGRGKYKFDIQLDLDLLKKNLSDTYIIILRLHYLIAENIDLSGYESFVFDLSFHEDIRELYLISDILITDYSSVFFDYANLKRPMIFYVYDIEEYRDNLRGFYFDFENEAPGPLVKTTKELLIAIQEVNEKKYQKEVHDFFGKFCSLEDGRASQKVIKHLFHT